MLMRCFFLELSYIDRSNYHNRLIDLRWYFCDYLFGIITTKSKIAANKALNKFQLM